ncbi:hypothetical protein CBR_g19407 [Chara braunii]|uniref:Uncharacterized protein n=1 Tax=Chara braunii TaxID=69332 RepID=A0A388KXW2_CHABU|nr:hypothetical protein CBR_g19407 [Chara braunii]|eukprot:GBG74894.1 hypothetical protein CBR_g19407 [Chara braunii]
MTFLLAIGPSKGLCSLTVGVFSSIGSSSSIPLTYRSLRLLGRPLEVRDDAGLPLGGCVNKDVGGYEFLREVSGAKLENDATGEVE